MKCLGKWANLRSLFFYARDDAPLHCKTKTEMLDFRSEKTNEIGRRVDSLVGEAVRERESSERLFSTTLF